MNVTLWVCWLGEHRVDCPGALGCVWHIPATSEKIQPKLYEDKPSTAYLSGLEPYTLLRININTETGDVSICEES